MSLRWYEGADHLWAYGAVRHLIWTKVDMGMGWNRHEGQSENYGPYIVEKEGRRSFSVWWGGVNLGEADHVATAKRMAQAHSNGLQRKYSKEATSE